MEFSAIDIGLRLLIGGGIGYCIGLTGVGGGVLAIPALTLFLKIPIEVAVGTASLFSSIIKVHGTAEHWRLKNIDYSSAFQFLAGAVPGNLLTTTLINRTLSNAPELHAKIQAGLQYAIIAVIVISMIMMLKKKKTSEAGSSAEHETIRVEFGQRLQRWGAGVAAGAVIGATSIGGVFFIPIFVLLFGLTLKRTVGTSIFVTLVLTALTSAVYGGSSRVAVSTAVCMALGSFLGVAFGSRMSVKLPEERLKKIVISVMAVAIVLMIFA